MREARGVGETTKDLTDIGRFGIGFKSVYSITQRPEVHSGEEDFAIENFVFPIAAPPTSRADNIRRSLCSPCALGTPNCFRRYRTA